MEHRDEPIMFPDEIAEEFRNRCEEFGSIVTLEDEHSAKPFRLINIRQRPGTPELIFQSLEDGRILREMELPNLAYDTLEAGGHVYANGYMIA